MASYELRIKPSAVKELRGIPLRDRKRIAARIATLASEPRPTGCEKQSGLERYRIRQGDYRILYEIEDAVVTIVVVRVAHRKDVYRQR